MTDEATRGCVARRRLVASAIGLALVLALFMGCGEEFDPRSYLTGLRVLALTSEPVEVVSGETVTLSASVYAPADDPIVSESWRFCPLTLGASSGYACVVESCDVALSPDDDGVVAADPVALGLACLGQLGSLDEPPPGVPPELPDVIDTVVRYRVESASGEVREAVLRVPVWLKGAPEQRNHAPRIQRVEWAGMAVGPGVTTAPVEEGAKVALHVIIDPQSLDSVTDETGRERQEQPVVSLFATAGRFEHDREAGADVTAIWKAKDLEAGDIAAEIYVVARDLRGGQAVVGPFSVPISRPDLSSPSR